MTARSIKSVSAERTIEIKGELCCEWRVSAEIQATYFCGAITMSAWAPNKKKAEQQAKMKLTEVLGGLLLGAQNFEATKQVDLETSPMETLESVRSERNWFANCLSYMMNLPLAGTPSDNISGWDFGPIIRPSPAQLVAIAKSLVAHGRNGFTYEGDSRMPHKPLPVSK